MKQDDIIINKIDKDSEYLEEALPLLLHTSLHFAEAWQYMHLLSLKLLPPLHERWFQKSSRDKLSIGNPLSQITTQKIKTTKLQNLIINKNNFKKQAQTYTDEALYEEFQAQ